MHHWNITNCTKCISRWLCIYYTCIQKTLYTLQSSFLSYLRYITDTRDTIWEHMSEIVHVIPTIQKLNDNDIKKQYNLTKIKLLRTQGICMSIDLSYNVINKNEKSRNTHMSTQTSSLIFLHLITFNLQICNFCLETVLSFNSHFQLRLSLLNFWSWDNIRIQNVLNFQGRFRYWFCGNFDAAFP